MDSQTGVDLVESSEYSSTQEPVPPPIKRNSTGWIFLAGIFVLLCVLQIIGTGEAKKQLTDSSRLDFELKAALSMKAAGNGLLKGTTDVSTSGITNLLQEVEKDRKSDAAAAEIYGLLRFEQGKPVQQKDVLALNTVQPLGPIIAQVLTQAKFSRADAQSIGAKILGDTFARKVLRADLDSKAGIPETRQRLDHQLLFSQGFEILLIGAVVLGSLVAWSIFAIKVLDGSLKPKGLPNLPPTLFEADQMAMRALVFFVFYAVLMVLSELASGRSLKNTNVISFVIGLATVAVYPLAVQRPWNFRIATFESLGMGKGLPWLKFVGLGLFGFLLEFPVSAIMSSIGEKLLPNQTSIHPAEAMLANSHNPWVIASLFLLASVQAPLYEETMFRGLLLPAVTRVTRSFIAGIAVTGLLFASLHPQGVGAWLGLFTIASSSAILIYYTRSLAPSIFLHMFHNAFTLALVLVMS